MTMLLYWDTSEGMTRCIEYCIPVLLSHFVDKYQVTGESRLEASLLQFELNEVTEVSV